MRAALVLVAACSAASSDPGLDSLVVIPGAQFRPGPFPSANGGPDSVQAQPLFPTTVIDGGTFDKVNGLLGTTARSAIIGVDGLDGAWILPAQFPGIENPDNPTITATLELAHDFPAGPFDVLIAGADVDGKIGNAARGTIIAADVAPPPGQLVFSLEWDNAADLDIHVIDPTGAEVWSEAPNSIPFMPGGDPFAFEHGGQLDHDGNASCRTAGTPNEHVVWKTLDHAMQPLPPPPSGTYTVRVDPRAMCGAPGATWYVAAYGPDGTLLDAARGLATPDDATYAAHGAGAGVTAITITR